MAAYCYEHDRYFPVAISLTLSLSIYIHSFSHTSAACAEPRVLARVAQLQNKVLRWSKLRHPVQPGEARIQRFYWLHWRTGFSCASAFWHWAHNIQNCDLSKTSKPWFWSRRRWLAKPLWVTIHPQLTRITRSNRKNIMSFVNPRGNSAFWRVFPEMS